MMRLPLFIAHGEKLIYVLVAVYALVIAGCVAMLVAGIYFVLRKEERIKERRLSRRLGYIFIAVSISALALIYAWR